MSQVKKEKMGSHDIFKITELKCLDAIKLKTRLITKYHPRDHGNGQ